MKVYREDNGERRLIGRADLAESDGPVYAVPLFGPVSIIEESFTIGTVTHLPESGGPPVVERAVLAAPGQLVDLLPGWTPLAS